MRKILVADDEKVVRDVITISLELKGYDVYPVRESRRIYSAVITL